MDPAWDATKDQFPEYNNHGDVLNRYWGRLTEERAEFQFHLVEGDEILARARCVPVRWDGTVEDLPAGIDGAIARGFDEEGANVLCAMLISVPRAQRGRGRSGEALRAMLDIARDARARGADRTGAAELEGPLPARPDRALRDVAARGRAPVRPVAARPRARRREGAEGRSRSRFASPARSPSGRSGRQMPFPESGERVASGTVAEWEEWTEMPFPESGEYVFPGGLATLEIDRERDAGSYWEPNVWMVHAV